MTTYAWPSDLGIESMDWGLERSTIGLENTISRAIQRVDLLGWQWVVQATMPPRTMASAGKLEAFLNTLVGGVDRVTMCRRDRPAPLGTLRGSPTLHAAVAQFSDTLVIQADPGVTLLPGDVVGVAPQLFQVREGATANGSGLMTVKVVNRTRSSLASGLPVVWDRPTATFVMEDDRSAFTFARMHMDRSTYRFREVPQ